MWLQLVFIIRACIVPNAEFDQIQKSQVQKTANAFYKKFESLFGKKNCSYSIHLISAHILQIRGDLPLTERSAFKYENVYSELRDLFQPGTISPSKQILKNCYMKRILENHNCSKSNFYDVESKGLEDNSLIYTFKNNVHSFFKIIEKTDNNNFVCNPQGRFSCKTDFLKEIYWDKVGVYEVGPYSNERVSIQREKKLMEK